MTGCHEASWRAEKGAWYAPTEWHLYGSTGVGPLTLVSLSLASVQGGTGAGSGDEAVVKSGGGSTAGESMSGNGRSCRPLADE
jgi:hypothetical protein